MSDAIAKAPAGERAAGTIYDLGYQHYNGERLGRANAIRTLMAYSFKAAFGAGRGGKAQAIPFLVLLFVFMPVFVMVAIASATGNANAISYAQYLPSVTFFLALFTAAQSPEVIVADRQYGVLSLYLSRSLSNIDYISAKLIAFTGALLVLTLGPQLTLFAGKVLISAAPWQTFTASYTDLGPIIGGTTLAACYMSFIGIAIAAFSARRAFASAGVIGFFVLMPALAGVARQLTPSDDGKRYAILGNPFLVISGFANWLWDVQIKARAVPNQFGARANARALLRADLPGHYYLYVMLGTCILGLALLLLRYRRTEV